MTTKRAAKTGRKTPAKTPTVVPGPNGGTLRRGNPGNRGGTGRPPNVIRAGLREAIPVEVAKLEANVARIEALVAEFEALDRSAEGEPEDSKAALERRESRLRSFMTLQERLISARSQLLEYRTRYGLGTVQANEHSGPEGEPIPFAVELVFVEPGE